MLNTIQNLNGARFASLTYIAKGSGEKAVHTLVLGVNVERAYRRDIAILRGKAKTLVSPVERQACAELLRSLRESLRVGLGNNSAYTCAGVYTSLARGIKQHNDNGQVHITGFTIGKKVIVEGVHKQVKSSAKTLAKNALRRAMKSGKFRQFVFDNLEGARLEGKTFTLGR